MPRYVNHDSARFWEIALAGTGFETRFGPIGGTAETSKKTFGDPARARSEYDRIVAQKLARGFVADDGARTRRTAKAAATTPAEPARNPELEAAIAKDLDDLDAHLVYADWLSDRGDPRGELIALQTKRGKDKAAAKLIAEQREHLLGDLHELSEESRCA